MVGARESPHVLLAGCRIIRTHLSPCSVVVLGGSCLPSLTVTSHGAKMAKNRSTRERIARTAEAILRAFDRGACARASTAATQDSLCRWRREAGLQDLAEACRGGWVQGWFSGDLVCVGV